MLWVINFLKKILPERLFNSEFEAVVRGGHSIEVEIQVLELLYRLNILDIRYCEENNANSYAWYDQALYHSRRNLRTWYYAPSLNVKVSIHIAKFRSAFWNETCDVESATFNQIAVLLHMFSQSLGDFRIHVLWTGFVTILFYLYRYLTFLTVAKKLELVWNDAKSYMVHIKNLPLFALQLDFGELELLVLAHGVRAT